MDARTYFLELYNHTHGSDEFPTSAASVILARTPEQMKTKLPGHNSIAWIIWHIARGEDWAINVMMRGAEQVLIRDGWNAKMGIEEPGWGFNMTDEAVAELTARIDLDAMRGYYDVVCAETRRFIETWDFDKLNSPLDIDAGYALSPEALGPDEEGLRRLVANNPATNRWFFNVFTNVDVASHFYEAAHVLGTMFASRSA